MGIQTKSVHKNSSDELAFAYDFLLKNKSDYLFENKKLENTILFQISVLNNLKHDLYIYQKSLDQVIYFDEKYVKTLKRFLMEGKTINIIVENDLSTISQKTKRNLEQFYFNNNFNIRLVNSEFKKDLLNHIVIESTYFLVGDSSIFRIENTDYKNPFAYANCFDIKFSKNLVKVFNKHFDQCEHII